MAQNNATANAIMDQILNGSNQADQSEQAIQMPELALRCAQFFHSLSQYCLYFYKNYNREADIHKTKLIKKVDKSKKHKSDQSRKQIAQDKKVRQQRGEYEPEPPKKPLTAYILYFQDKKPSFAEKFPTLSLSQLTKLIAKDWKDLKEEEKKPYLDRASEDRKRYETEMIEFKRNRLGDSGKNDQEFIVEENKGESNLDQKEEQIPIEIEEEIKAAELLNEAENGIKSEREDGVNDEEDDEDEDGEEDEDSEGSENEDGDDDEIQNEGSEEAKINQE